MAELPLFRKMADGSAAAELIAQADAIDRPRPWPHGFDRYRQIMLHWLEQYAPTDMPWPAADQITDAMQRGILPADYAFALIRQDCASQPPAAENHTAELLEALKRVRDAFYVAGTSKALRAAFAGTKELVAKVEGRA